METPEYLVIEIRPYDEWNRTVTVRASANGFAGRGLIYVSLDAIHEFVDGIEEYPLSKSAVLNGGYVGEEHVRIEVSPVGRLGQVGAVVHLAEPRTDDPGRHEAREEVWLELLTTYERLRRFAISFRELLAADGGQPWTDAWDVRLEGERLVP